MSASAAEIRALEEIGYSGLARAVVATLAAWGRSAGATRGFLETDSRAARALYARFGFVEQYTHSDWMPR